MMRETIIEGNIRRKVEKKVASRALVGGKWRYRQYSVDTVETDGETERGKRKTRKRQKQRKLGTPKRKISLWFRLKWWVIKQGVIILCVCVCAEKKKRKNEKKNYDTF